MSLGEKTVRGLFWGYGTFVIERTSTLAITVVLARLLVPAEIGLFAGAVLIISVIEAFGRMGIPEALIHAPQSSERTRNTGFFLDLVIGVLQWGVIFTCAPLGVHFIDDPEIVPILRVMAFAPLINALSRTQQALLQRELDFKRRYICDLSAVSIKTVVAISCAYAGLGVWSLVVAQISGMGARTILQWLFTGWRPGFVFSLTEAKSLLSYGVHILIVGLVSLAASRGDQMFIGSILGQVSLGYYFMGVRIPELILFGFGGVLTQIVFPVLVKARSCRKTLMDAFFAATRYATYVVVPVALGIMSVAPELIPVSFGNQWEATVPITQIFSVVGLVGILPWVVGDVFKALGRPDLMTKLTVLHVVVEMPVLWAFIYFSGDVVVAAWAVLLSTSVSATVHLWYASRFLNFSPAVYVGLFGKPLAAGAIMVAAVYGCRAGLGDMLSTEALLVSLVATGALVYGAAVWLIEPSVLRDGQAVVMVALTARKASPGEPDA